MQLRYGDKVLFIDDYRRVISTLFHPWTETRKKMSIAEGLLYYVKGTVIPFALLLVSIVVFINAFSSNVVMTFSPPFSNVAQYLIPYGNIGQVAVLILAFLTAFYLLALIWMASLAAIIYTVGKVFVTHFKGNYQNTFSGIVYGTAAALSLIWIPLLGITIGGFFHSAIIALLFAFIGFLGLLWGAIVEIVAISVQDSMPEYISALFLIIIAIVIFILGQGNLWVGL